MIEHANKLGKNRLPTMSELAHHAGVSVTTMGKVVTQFQTGGILTVHRKKGIVLAHSKTDEYTIHQLQQNLTTDLNAATTRWEQVVGYITHDILTGKFGPKGILPSYKELTNMYGTCYRVMRKALFHLCSQRVLLYEQRHFRFVAPLKANKNRIILYIFGHSDGKQLVLSHMYEYWHRLVQNTVTQAGLALVTIPCGLVQLQGAVQRLDTPSKKIVDTKDIEDALGIILMLGAPYISRVRNVVNQLSCHTLPISVIDCSVRVKKPATRKNRSVQEFDLGCGKEPGRAVGRYLTNLGHRKIVFLTFDNDEPWSQLRLWGLRETMALSGSKNQVIVISAQKGDYENPLEYSVTDYCEVLDDTVSYLNTHTNTRYHHLADALSANRFEIWGTIRKQNLANAMNGVFYRTLEENVTAWVCANDAIAVEAMDFLTLQNIAIPGQLSIIGFDDTREAHIRGITSYNFNCSAAVNSAVAHIRNMKAGRFAIPKSSGFLNIRTSSAPPMQ